MSKVFQSNNVFQNKKFNLLLLVLLIFSSLVGCTGSGHGDGYGGLRLENFYLHRDSLCKPELSHDKLEVTSTKATLKQLDPATCEHKEIIQDLNSIEFPQLTRQISILNDKIYDQYINFETLQVDRAVEYYCYWQPTDQARTEMIIRRFVLESYKAEREALIWEGVKPSETWNITESHEDGLVRTVVGGTHMQYKSDNLDVLIDLRTLSTLGYAPAMVNWKGQSYNGSCKINRTELIPELGLPNDAIAGQETEMSFTVHNIGNSSSERFQTRYDFDLYIEGTEINLAAFGGTTGYTHLQAGESYTQKIIKSSLPAGLWHAKVCILPEYYSEGEGIFNDIDASNNCVKGQFYVSLP